MTLKYRYKIIVTGDTKEEISKQLERLAADLREGHDNLRVENVMSGAIRKITPTTRTK